MSDFLAHIRHLAFRLLELSVAAALLTAPASGQTCPSPGTCANRAIIPDAPGGMPNSAARPLAGRLALALPSEFDTGRAGLVGVGKAKTPDSANSPACIDVEAIVPLPNDGPAAIAGGSQKCQVMAQAAPAPPPDESRLDLKLEWESPVQDLRPLFDFGQLKAKARYTAGNNETKTEDFAGDRIALSLRPGVKGFAGVVDASGTAIAEAKPYDLSAASGRQLTFILKPAKIRAELASLDNPADPVEWRFRLASGGSFKRSTNGLVFEGVIPPGEWSIEATQASHPGPPAKATFKADFGKLSAVQLAFETAKRLGKLTIKGASDAEPVLGPVATGSATITAVPIDGKEAAASGTVDANVPLKLNEGRYNIEISIAVSGKKTLLNAIDAVTIGGNSAGEINLISPRGRLMGHALLDGKALAAGLTWRLQWGNEKPVEFSGPRFDQPVRPGTYILSVSNGSATAEKKVTIEAEQFTDLPMELRR